MTEKRKQEIALVYVENALTSSDIMKKVELENKLKALGIQPDEADEFAMEVVNPIIHGHP